MSVRPYHWVRTPQAPRVRHAAWGVDHSEIWTTRTSRTLCGRQGYFTGAHKMSNTPCSRCLAVIKATPDVIWGRLRAKNIPVAVEAIESFAIVVARAESDAGRAELFLDLAASFREKYGLTQPQVGGSSIVEIRKTVMAATKSGQTLKPKKSIFDFVVDDNE